MKIATTMFIGTLLGIAMISLTDSAVADWERPAQAQANKNQDTKSRAPASAAKPVKPAVRQEPPILAGAAIKVVGFDSKNRTLEVKIIDEPAVGPNITKPEDLLAAVGFEDEGDRKRFMEDPRRFVGAEYTLEEDLKLIAPETLKKK